MTTSNSFAEAEARAIASIAREGMNAQIVTLDDGLCGEQQVLVLPNKDGSLRTESVKKLLAEYRTEPERREGTAALTDLPSFCAHVNRFKDEDSAIFANNDATKPSLLAVLDYHRQGADGDPRFGKHRAVYEFPLSDAWTAWTAQDGKTMSQRDFALWLEDHLEDVADPSLAGKSAKSFLDLHATHFASAARLLELSRGLSVHVGRQIVNAENLSTGEGHLVFQEKHSDQAGKPLTVPGAFLLALPVFRSGVMYQVPARLRYRIDGGQVVWSFNIYRPRVVFDDAIAEACEIATKETALPLFMGRPEA